MDIRLHKLLDAFPEEGYITALMLAKNNGVSEKTIRSRIKELDKELRKNGAEIVSRQRVGYRLVVSNKEKYEGWIRKLENSDEKAIPTTPMERCQYLLALFLTRQEYFKQQDISEFLFIGTKTISSEIKRVEYILNSYEIQIERRPGYGMRALGKEFDFRRCMMDYLVKPDYHALNDVRQQEKCTELIGSILLKVLQECQIHMSETSFQNLVLYLYVSSHRIKHGLYVGIDYEIESDIKISKEYKAAELLVQRLLDESIFMKAVEEEIFFVSRYIAGRRSFEGQLIDDTNTVIAKKTNEMVQIMLDSIYQTYGVDFRDDLNIRMILCTHMQPFAIRMQYGIPLKNPLLDEIEKKYAFALSIAQCGTSALAKYYGNEIPLDETAYFAILIEMAMQERRGEITKKSIVLVCVSGNSSSQFLVYRLKREFGEYIDEVYHCDLYNIPKFDFKKVDYVFTTVPIHYSIPVPIVEISNFLEQQEVVKVRGMLNTDGPVSVYEYYKSNQFFINIDGETKEEVLKSLCEQLSKVRDLPTGFYEAVIRREEIGGTDFGNFTAIPHPDKIIIEENVICVGILSRPVFWGRSTVQVVILTSVYDSVSDATQKFFELTSNLISNRNKIEKIIEAKSFDVFIDQLLEGE